MMDSAKNTKTKSGAGKGYLPPYDFKKCPSCGKQGYYTPKPWTDDERNIRYVFPNHCYYCDHKGGETKCVDPKTDRDYDDVASLMAARNKVEEKPDPLDKEEKVKKVKELFK